MFPNSQVPYFNDGSCVHPSSITGIEITDWITLVRWSTKQGRRYTLYVGREELKSREIKGLF